MEMGWPHCAFGGWQMGQENTGMVPPLGLKRKRGRPKIKWDHEMRKCCGGVAWKRVALDRAEWRRMSAIYVEAWLPQEK